MPQVITTGGAYGITGGASSITGDAYSILGHANAADYLAAYLRGAQQAVASGCSSNNNIWTNWQQTCQASATTIWTHWIVQSGEQQGLQTAQNRAAATNVFQLEATAKVEASARATALLKSMLSAPQRQQYENEQAFEVVTCRSGATRRYKLKHGWAGNVFLLNEAGREVEKFCIHPSTAVPEADNLVAQKLLLESDELTFLRTANRTILSDLGWVVAARAA